MPIVTEGPRTVDLRRLNEQIDFINSFKVGIECTVEKGLEAAKFVIGNHGLTNVKVYGPDEGIGNEFGAVEYGSVQFQYRRDDTLVATIQAILPYTWIDPNPNGSNEESIGRPGPYGRIINLDDTD